MNKNTLLIAALIAAAALLACSNSGHRQPQRAAATAESLVNVADTTPAYYRPTYTPAQVQYMLDSLKHLYATRATSPAHTATAPAAQPAQQTATATICPQTYTPKKGAQAGQAQEVHTGSRGGCYYLNSTGNKTYLKK